jgi:hypothetical protein
MNTEGLKRKARYNTGDYVVFKYGYRNLTGVILWANNIPDSGPLVYRVDGVQEGVFFKGEIKYEVRIFRRQIYGLCEDQIEIEKIRNAGLAPAD